MTGDESLASSQHCVGRICAAWPAFLARRADRRRQQARHGQAAEKVAEMILVDLFTQVLDWADGDRDDQVGHADLVLTQNLVKFLVVEAQRPGALAWNRTAVHAALEQARRYADEQKVPCVPCIVVSDGVMLYAAELLHGGLAGRVFVSLDRAPAPEVLWWLSVHGVYRPREGTEELDLPDLRPAPAGPGAPAACTPGSCPICTATARLMRRGYPRRSRPSSATTVGRRSLASQSPRFRMS